MSKLENVDYVDWSRLCKCMGGNGLRWNSTRIFHMGFVEGGDMLSSGFPYYIYYNILSNMGYYTLGG